MPFLRATRRQADERLLWSRDIRFVHRLAARLPEAHVLELDSGTVLIASAERLTDAAAADVAASSGSEHPPEYGLVPLDATLPERDRYLTAMSSAVQVSGLAERIGMAQSTQVIQTKMLDYFFSLRKLHHVAFQPIVELATGDLHEYECLFRPEMPMLPQSISSIVQAGIDTGRGVELDTYLVTTILARVGQLEAAARGGRATGPPVAINLPPGTLLDPRSTREAWPTRSAPSGLEPRQITVECTEQQAVADLVQLRRQVKSLRRAGFGMAVDDAGAGYASFALIAALRPSIIKIDRDIVARHRPRQRQAGARRRVRVVRPPDRRPARGRRHRAPSGPGRAGPAWRRPRPGLPPRQAGRRAGPPPRRHAVRADPAVTGRLAYHRGHDRDRRQGNEPPIRPRARLTDEIRAFLDDTRFASIATIDPDGTPRPAVIWYTVDGDDIVINSKVGRRWPSNLVRDPRIAFSVVDGTDGYRWVGLHGVVTVVEDQATAQADIAGMARRYHADDPDEAERLVRERFEREARISFRIHPIALTDHRG